MGLNLLLFMAVLESVKNSPVILMPLFTGECWRVSFIQSLCAYLLTRHKRDGKEKYVIDVIIEGLSFIEVIYLSLTGL